MWQQVQQHKRRNMKYYRVERFVKIQEVQDKDVESVPSDWIEVQKNGEPLKQAKRETKKTK